MVILEHSILVLSVLFLEDKVRVPNIWGVKARRKD